MTVTFAKPNTTMATPQHSGEYERKDGGSPAPPPPPPPSPPPHDTKESQGKAPPPLPISTAPVPPSDKAPKRVDYRELFAFFHADVEDPIESRATWDTMWQLALAEAKEDLRVHQMEAKKQPPAKKRGSDSESLAMSSTPSRAALAARLSAGSTATSSSANTGSTSSHSTTASGADKRPRPPLPSDSDPNKAMRLNRTSQPTNRPKPASKLMQKLGNRGI